MCLRAMLVVLGALLMSAPDAPGSEATTARLLTDFSPDGDDLGWFVVNDNVMGGRSQGGFAREGDVLRFQGRTNTNGGGFSSIRTGPLRLDLSAYEGIRLRVLADGRRYTWRLTTDARWRGRTISYWADFETSRGAWEVIDIPFSRFRPQFRGQQLAGPELDVQKIEGMGLMIYDKLDGPFEMRVDSVHAYTADAPFRLSELRGRQRVLILAAPASDDARLLAQLASIDAARAGFDERDLVLVVALEAGTSYALDRALTRAETDTLRSDLDLEAGSFGLRLVGKDGGVKLTSLEPVPMQRIHELIDAMPMRRAELREQTGR